MSQALTGRLAKPQLRGLLTSSFRKHAIIATIFTTVNVALFKYFVVDARKKKYAEFYKNYDADAECDRMAKLGLFQSIKE